jgi:gliding motility-associated-like protein
MDANGLFNPDAATVGMNTVVYTVTDGNGCTDQDSIEVEVYGIPVNTITMDPEEGCEPLTVNFSTEPEDNIIWRINGVEYSTNSVEETFQSGIYTVELLVTNSDGCSDTVESTLPVYENPTAAFGISPEKIYFSDPRAQFSDSSYSDIRMWEWSFGDGGFSSEQNPEYRYAGAGTYTVLLTVENSDGCRDSTLGTVTVLDELLYFIPNGFSPNDDGNNDVFKVTGLGIQRIQCAIYNRWGEKLLDLPNFEEWDGTYRGEPAPMGVYVYLMTLYDNRNMKHHVSGEIHLIR